MKKNICGLCNNNKGKRLCILHNNQIICPLCCAKTRGPDCNDCLYYKEAERYSAGKDKKNKYKDFIAVIDPEVEKAVDQALSKVEKGNIREGEAILSSLKKDYPRNHTVLYGLGVVNAFKEEYDKAIEYFDKAINIFPYLVEAHFNKAIACQKKIDIKNMVLSFQKVVEIGNPKDRIVIQAKKMLYDFEQTCIKHEGITIETYLEGMEKFEKAVNYMHSQKWERAIFWFKECLVITKNHPQSYGNMGICYLKLGQKEQALKALDKAIEIDPNYELAIVNRRVAEVLKDGEEFAQRKIETIEYYKEYPMKKKSYIQAILQKFKKEKQSQLLP